MRHVLVGAGLLAVALVVTLAAASILQGMAVANRTVDAEPFVIDTIRPDSTVTRPRTEPGGSRSVILASRRTES